jgi:hypothetical protein
VNTITIFAPRFKDMKVLVAPYRVVSGQNRIVFTKTWQDKVLFMDGERMKSYPQEWNGKIGCLAIPVDDFETEASLQLELI